MDSFVWDQDYVIGQNEIDSQHQHLISVINRLGTLPAERGAFSSAEIGVVFSELAAYTQYHFREEEEPSAWDVTAFPAAHKTGRPDACPADRLRRADTDYALEPVRDLSREAVSEAKSSAETGVYV